MRGGDSVVSGDPGERLKPPAADPYNAAITWLDEPLRGAAEGPLAGRTLLVKDLIDTAGIRTTYGSQIYGDHVPDAHATVVQRALDAGAVVVGKGNLPEFAWGVLGVNPLYGAVHNPLHPGKTTGGSSAGNAAALAAGLVDLGLGTDTGCSIRLPSAACGTVGLKPRWGSSADRRRLPARADARHGRPDGADASRTSRCSGRCSSGRPVPEPRLDGLTVGPPAARPRARRRAQDRVERRGRAVGRRARAARRAGRRGGDPGAKADMWPLFLHEAAHSHRATFPLARRRVRAT